MKRYKKFVLEEEKGITFEVSERTSGDLVIMARNIVSSSETMELLSVSAGEYAKVLSMYTDKDGNKAVVPPGWTVSGVAEENIIWGKDKGLVIYHIPEVIVNYINWQDSSQVETLMETYDQFVWTPVSLLTANGTLDGIHFNEKFGRMNYQNEKFSGSKYYYYEPLVGELSEQKESVDKYDGYYTSRYKISKDKRSGRPRSVKGEYPWTNIILADASVTAETLESTYKVKSHLMYGAEYDTQLKWLIESGTVATKEIAKDSIELGNNHNNGNYSNRIVKTGEDGCINNIYGVISNTEEWTKETYGDEESCLTPRVCRGGIIYRDRWEYFSVAARKGRDPLNEYENTGFRIALRIK